LTHGPNSLDLDMRRLRSGVTLEADAGLLQQFGGHAEIALRILESSMSEIDRQVGQEPLDVLALAIPGDEANDRERVTEVMQSWLEGSILGARYAGLFTKAA
jgi:ribosomal protein S7